MIKKELTNEERNLLLHCLQRWHPELIPKLDVLDSARNNVINNMRHAINKEFLEAFPEGLKKKEYYNKLEDLIDRLFDLYIH
jgi:hypothetical protein